MLRPSPLVLLAALAACAPQADLAIECDDLAPADEARFPAVAALVTDPGPRGCAGCHNTDSPVAGLNFEGPGVAWDALTTRPELIYAQVASGAMPEDGVRWSEGELRLLRTWLCDGGVYEDP